jgi:TolB-like protein
MRHEQFRRAFPRHAGFIASMVLGLIAGTASAELHAQTSARVVADHKPTVAVMEFDNAAMVKRDEFAALTSGFQVMLTNAIATNPSIEVVERQKIQHLLDEQNLNTAGRVDAATAAKVGQLLGVRHMLMGSFTVAPNMEMRLSVRSVNTETGVIEYTEAVTGKGDKVFNLIDQLAAKINSGLKLPGIRDAKAVKENGLDGPNQLEAAKAFSAAQRLEERGDTKAAIAMYQKSVALNGEFGMAKTSLASLERGTPR